MGDNLVSVQILTEASNQLCSIIAIGERMLTADDVAKVWYTLGRQISASLLINKGVRIEKFGTFTMSARGDPVFVFANEFTHKYRLTYPTVIPSTSIANSKINFSVLSAESEIPRGPCEQIIHEILNSLGNGIASGNDCSLTFFSVAEFTSANRNVNVKFLPEFNARYNQARGNAPSGPAASKTARPLSASKQRPNTNSQPSPSGRPSSAGRPSSRAGERPSSRDGTRPSSRQQARPST